MIYLRNTHPKRHTLVPIAPGWMRIVPPQACAGVPAVALASRHVQRALADQRLTVVTEVTASADARNALALRTELARAIAQVERDEFARLIARQERERRASQAAHASNDRRWVRWTPERKAEFAGLWNSGLSTAEIGAKLGMSPGVVRAVASQQRLAARQRPRSAGRTAMVPQTAGAV